MRRLVCCLSVVGFLCGAAPAEGPERREAVQALQADVQKAARVTAPSVASILVSRSDDYHTAPHWGTPASVDAPGRLGPFHAAAALARVPADAPDRARIAAAIKSLDLSNQDTVPESYGSGFVVGPDLVLTCAHVVRGATRIYVRFPGGRGAWADVHASDPRSDLAVLRLLEPVPELKPLPLGKGETVERGQVLLTVVNSYTPRFRDGEVVADWGVVSKLRQKAGNLNESERGQKATLHHYGTLIQTSARTTPGCSGGVLVDLSGQVVGMTTAMVAVRGADGPDRGSQGSLGIPFDASTRRIVEVLRRGEEVEYGFLGVTLAEWAPAGRVVIGGVSPGSPAARAGLRKDDVIVGIGGQAVREADDLFLFIGMALAGTSIEVQVDRGGRRSAVRPQLAKYKVPGPIVASRRPPARGGLRVDYTSLLSQPGLFQLWGKPTPEGVIIREVIPGSPADKAALQPDKVITAVNGRTVTTPEEYYREAARADGRLELTVVNSDGRGEAIVLELK